MSEAERTRRLDYRRIRKKWISLQAAILAVVILVTLVSAVVYFRLDKTHYINYTEQCVVDYGVYLKENEFYEKNYLGKDQAYVASLIERVVADFEYQLFMDTAEKVDFRYSYQIDAVLQITDKTSGAILFAPVYEVLPMRTAERTANGLIIHENVQLDYAQYNDLANKFIDTYDLANTSSHIVLQMKVNVLGASDEFSNSTESNEYIVELNIPLTTQVVHVNMTAGIPEEENKILACNTSVARLVFRVISIVFLCVGILLAIEVIAFVYLTRNTDITYEIRVSRLLKSYKSFIQKINNPFDVTGYQLLMVDTFNEMLEIRDTIQSPILMNENTDKTCTKFLIPTNTKILYVYELKVDDYDEIYGTNESVEETVETDTDSLDATIESESTVSEAPAISEPTATPVSDEPLPTEEPVAPAEEVVECPVEEVVERPVVKIVEKPIVVTVERPVVEFVEKPIEVILNRETPVQQSVAVSAMPESIDEDDEDDIDDIDGLDDSDDETDENGASNGYSNIRRSFTAKLIQSTEDKKRYYSEIKNELLSYRSVKARISWNTESFNKGRTHLAKLAIRGKTLCLCLALDPAELADSKYFYTDVSDKMRYRTVPIMIKIKSNRGVKHAKELIELLAARYDLKKKDDFEPVDYTVPHRTTEELIAQGLIKDPDGEYGKRVTYEPQIDALIDGMIQDVTDKLTSEEPKAELPPHVAASAIKTTFKIVEVPSETLNEAVPEEPCAEAPKKTVLDGVQLLESVSAERVVEALKEPDPVIADIDYVDTEEPEVENGVEVVDVVWKEKETENALHRYDPNGAVLSHGDIVLVPAKDEGRGKEVIRKAAVAHSNHKVDPEGVESPLKKIIGVLKRKMQDAINSSID